MKVLIIGAAGMIGRKLTERIAVDGRIGELAIDSIFLHDVVASTARSSSIPTSSITSDLGDPGVIDRILGDRPNVIFHLAAVLSGEAESDFEKGYRVNLENTRAYLRPFARPATATGLVSSSRRRLPCLASLFRLPSPTISSWRP
jgi:nucleoside-diphosphate-sugar epimerase